MNKRGSIGSGINMIVVFLFTLIVYIGLGKAIEELFGVARTMLESSNALWFIDFYSFVWWKLIPATIIVLVLLAAIYSKIRQENYTRRI